MDILLLKYTPEQKKSPYPYHAPESLWSILQSDSGVTPPPCAGVMHSFAGMDHNEDTTWNIEQIPNSLDLMSIFLDSVLRD